VCRGSPVGNHCHRPFVVAKARYLYLLKNQSQQEEEKKEKKIPVIFLKFERCPTKCSALYWEVLEQLVKH